MISPPRQLRQQLKHTILTNAEDGFNLLEHDSSKTVDPTDQFFVNFDGFDGIWAEKKKKEEEEEVVEEEVTETVLEGGEASTAKDVRLTVNEKAETAEGDTTAPKTLSASEAVRRLQVGATLIRPGTATVLYIWASKMRYFELSRNCKEIYWYSKQKKLSDTTIPLKHVTNIVTGQHTSSFKKLPQYYKQKKMRERSFSISYRDYGGQQRTLNVIAWHKNQRTLWVSVIVYLVKQLRGPIGVDVKADYVPIDEVPFFPECNEGYQIVTPPETDASKQSDLEILKMKSRVDKKFVTTENALRDLRKVFESSRFFHVSRDQSVKNAMKAKIDIFDQQLNKLEANLMDFEEKNIRQTYDYLRKAYGILLVIHTDISVIEEKINVLKKPTSRIS